MVHHSTPTRRTVLAVVGTGIGGGLVGPTAAAQQTETPYALIQGDACARIRPLRGREPVRAFYDYQLPERFVSDVNGASVGDGVPYSSSGTTDLQRAQTSLAFLYRGPGGVHLVVVHGSVDAPNPGSVTFRLGGLPDDGAWLVRDDYYVDPETGEVADSNYDRWAVDGATHRIDWTWGSQRTDGGVFGPLGAAFDVTVEPAFNEAAALFEEHYRGRVDDWAFLTRTTEGLTRFSLAMDEPIRIAAGRCSTVAGGPATATPAGAGGATGRDDGGGGPTGPDDGGGGPDDDDDEGRADDGGDGNSGRGRSDEERGNEPDGRGPPGDDEGRGNQGSGPDDGDDDGDAVDGDEEDGDAFDDDAEGDDDGDEGEEEDGEDEDVDAVDDDAEDDDDGDDDRGPGNDGRVPPDDVPNGDGEAGRGPGDRNEGRGPFGDGGED